MTNAEYYDPDDVGNRSPLPEKVKVDYGPHLSPPPSVPASSPSTSPGPEENDVDLASEAGTEKKAKRLKKSKPKRKKHKASIGDTVLLSYLDPNRPDIAQKAGQQVLNSASQSEAEDEEEEAEVEVGAEAMGAVPENGVHNNSSEAILTAKAAEALAVVRRDDDLEMVDAPQDQPPEQKKEDLPDAPTMNGVIHHDREPESSQAFTKPGPPAARSALNVIPPPRQPRPPLVISNERSRSVEERHRDEDSTPISPTLVKYAMSPSDADPESILPAIQKSPPRSASAHSPEGTQSLPSLHTTLSGLSDPGINGINAPSPFPPSSSYSPQFIRHSTFSSQTTGPSPGAYSQPSPVMSPPGYPGQPSHPSYWRRAPTEGSMSTPSTYEASTPASISGPSPAQSYPTPNVQDHRESVEGSSTPQLLNGPLQANGPFTSSTFKCNYAGCTAAPFQTQYLLNSHANVHSSNRPHFCPVADCPRGPGGKGFKRKNEMIRHGLVHQSPGYICPFCPDQQHRYPRPDNLQRHVRVHHIDKDRDDPQLRVVLAQRPEGGNRGRRRRAGG